MDDEYTILTIDQTQQVLSTLIHAWFPEGERPSPAVTGAWDSIKLLGAVSDSGESFFLPCEENFNSDTTIRLLDALQTEFGEKICVVLDNTSYFDSVVADGTKCHSQDEDRSYHSVQATLGEDIDDESRSLLDLSVNTDWDETAAELDDIDAVTDDATVVSDADDSIVTAFTDENRRHQLDLVHVGRTLDYNLRDDGVFSRDRRTEIVSEVIDEMFHLKNSVTKHRPEKEFAAIRGVVCVSSECESDAILTRGVMSRDTSLFRNVRPLSIFKGCADHSTDRRERPSG